MKTLIVYATKYGSTEKCAKLLSDKLSSEVELCNLKLEKNIDLSKYDKVIIGTSVYMGRIRKEINEFFTNNLNELITKKLGVFQCSMSQGADAVTQIENTFPKELVNNAVAKEHFGGEFSFDKMNFFERFIVKMVSKKDNNNQPIDTSKKISNISEQRISEFAQAMNDA